MSKAFPRIVYSGSVYLVVLNGSVNNVNISSCCINVLPDVTSFIPTVFTNTLLLLRNA